MTNFFQDITDKLKSANIEDPKLEARMIFAFVLNKDANDFYFSCPEITEEDKAAILRIVQKRTEHFPLCKLLGTKGFYKYDFVVNEDVLSPRPDTEILVEAAVRIMNEHGFESLLDLGTGSGCIPLSILGDVKGAKATAVDISQKALQIAKLNAQNLNMENRIEFVQGSWFDEDIVLKLEKKYDVIVSNPPYIPSQDILNLSIEVKNHDPLLALDGGEDGLDSYKRIAQISKEIISDGGFILLESGAGQAQDIEKIFEKEGFMKYKILKDYANIERCVILKK